MPAKILWLQDLTKDDLHETGEQAVRIGTLLNDGFPFPQGFVIPSSTYFHFLHQNKLILKINKLLDTINYRQQESVAQVATHIKRLIKQAPLDEALIKQIDAGYHKLSGRFSDSPVVLSSSATKELISFLSNPSPITTQGEANVILKVRDMWASLFEPNLLLMRHEKHIDHFHAGIAVMAQKKIDEETSGLMLTIDPVSNDTTKILIETQRPSEYYEIGKRNLSLINKLTDTKQEKITVNQAIDLATLGKQLEKQTYFPQQIQWTIAKNKIYFLKATPILIHDPKQLSTPQPTKKLQAMLQGIPAAKGLVKGMVKKIRSIADLEKISNGDILVTHEVTPAYHNAIKKAGAVIVETGGRTSHAALYAREHGIPAIVGANDAISLLPANMLVTVDGSAGVVYKPSGAMTLHPQTATHVYISLNDPALADLTSHEDTDGVLFVTPHATDTKETSETLTALAKAYTSRPVIYRLPDHRQQTLGWQGMQRYLHEPELFEHQLNAIKKSVIKPVKHIALPLLRTVKELEDSKHLLSKHGINRSATTKIWITVATPANVFQLDELIKHGIDGIVIDADMLTMLALGIDKQVSEVARYFDPTNPAVLSLFEQTITTANKNRLPVLIYGEGPSHHSSLLTKLVDWGITSIAVTPDVVHKTRREIKVAELRMLRS